MIQHEGHTYGTRSEYAEHIGASAPYVTKLGKQGRLLEQVIDGKRMVNFEMTDRMVRNTADLSKVNNGRNAAPERPPSAPLTALSDSGSNRVDVVYRQAQAQERVYNAKLAELDYKKAVGEVVLAAEVEAEWSRAFANFREALNQVPSRLAPVVTAETDEAKNYEMIAAEIRTALLQLKGGD